MPYPELNAERIIEDVQRMLQANKDVNFQDGMQVHLVHVSMPRGGVASRKREHYVFKFFQVSRYQKMRPVANLKKGFAQCVSVPVLSKKNNLTGILFVRDVNGK